MGSDSDMVAPGGNARCKGVSSNKTGSIENVAAMASSKTIPGGGLKAEMYRLLESGSSISYILTIPW